jgi:hypothetical protein
MDYRYEATTVGGFIQQLAVGYIAHGYWFYVSGFIPPEKDPHTVDGKLIEKYNINLSKFARHRRKGLGQANVQYLRFERFFVLLATHGSHRFFWPQEEGGEGSLIKDVREHSIKFASYSVSARKRTGDGKKWVAHVGIDQHTYRDLKGHLVETATRRTAESLEREFGSLDFEPYAPVRRQLWTILNRVNQVRREAGLPLLEAERCIRMKRRLYRPFAEPGEAPNLVGGKTTDVGSFRPLREDSGGVK